MEFDKSFKEKNCNFSSGRQTEWWLLLTSADPVTLVPGSMPERSVFFFSDFSTPFIHIETNVKFLVYV